MSAWADAIAVGDLSTLKLVIELIMEFYELTGYVITPAQLRDALNRPGS